MKRNILLAGLWFFLAACSGPKEVKMGTYAYDTRFFNEHNIPFVELVSADGNARVMVIPAWQGRVMTTSAAGHDGDSYGWINHRYISAGKVSNQFNPVGGEERLWLGPEGGPFSLYFDPGQEQIYAHWRVPAMLDTEAFEITAQDTDHIRLVRQAQLTNAAGTTFQIQLDRTVSLMDTAEVARDFGIPLSKELKMVAYRTDNILTNRGNQAWTKEGGLVSIWMLGCFAPTPTTTVFIPYKQDGQGPIVNDAYFGQMPEGRLVKQEGLIYFKIDGRHRSKIGLSPSRATSLCGSYDASKGVLTILWCNLPDTPATYLNGQWGPQQDPFAGDVINSYNDGPVEDGSIMGPFYEIETSSPGAELAPGSSLVHTQKVVHLQGTEAQIEPIVNQLFGASLDVIKRMFL